MVNKMEPRRLKPLLTKKIELMERILELTRLQPSLMEKDDETEALMRNITERQRRIDELVSIQGEIPNPESLRGDDECVFLAARARALFADIHEQDMYNERFALDRMEKLREKLRKSREGQISLRGYEHVGDIGALYFDVQK